MAQQIDGPGRTDAQDAATLIFLSSLSQAVNPTLGLDRSDIAAYLEGIAGRSVTESQPLPIHDDCALVEAVSPSTDADE